MILLAVVVPLVVVSGLAGWRARGLGRPGLASMAGGIAVVVPFWALIGLGEGTGIEWALVLVGLPPLVFFAVARLAPATAPSDRWTSPTDAGAPVLRHVRWTPSSPSAVATALGRVEARELVRSPWFAIGVGFAVLMFAVFGLLYSTDTLTWEGFFQLSPWLAHPLVGLTVLACHRATTRDRRDQTDELFETCPTEPATRTAGFLLTAPVPVVVLALMLASLTVAIAVNSDDIHGPIGLDLVGDVAGALLLGVGGVVLGVALGRWIRFGLAPVAAVVAVGFASLSINGVGGNDWHPVTLLSTAPAVGDTSPMFQDRPMGWHVVWIIGLVVLVGLVAFARHRRDRPVVVAAVASTVVLAVAGVGVTRPMPGVSAERIASYVSQPEAAQECVATDGPVQVCAFPYHRYLRDQVADRVSPIAAALPDGLEPLTMRQRYDEDIADLPPEVRRLVDPDGLVRPDREVPLGFGSELEHPEFDPGFDLVFVALGIPPEADAQKLPTVLAGEARGVVAIWLTARELDADDTARVSTSPAAGSPDPFERGLLEVVEPCAIPAAVWSAQDFAAARSVLALPAAEVQTVVVGGWDRWTDPRTGTDEFLAELGVAAHGPYDEVVARPGQGC